jgi:hypothetical protein
MARSKRHHYVPQGLQKYFCNEAGQIWYTKRASLLEKFCTIEPRNTKSAFQERNFYTVLSDLDEPSDEIEREFYGVVDDQVGKTLAEVVEIARLGTAPRFYGEPLNSFKNLVLALYRRSVDITKDYNELEIGEDIIKNTVADASKKLGLTTDEALKQLSFPDRKQLGRNVRVRAQTVEPKLALEALAAHNVATIFAEGKSSFILGSRMIYCISNGTNDPLGSRNVELWFPISPKLCLVLHALEQQILGPIVWPSRKVREFNEYIVSRCHEVGSHSDRLLISLLGQSHP